ncbi:flavodoxin family protein [Histomonas meleagridis]|uniref:flavodoxin family protein n=1 Tax=Histomonas meleagridis TaxID=135588 RepID=UPI00355A5B65|nr:flavodoxin family protein [Histomonas meleagridis]KAH0799751.1 flavodoxin family protein [Histomonas meleagridis]
MLKKVVAFNGSGRKNGNTAQMLKKFLEGASSQGAQTELVHLSDLNFKGCQGCLSCHLTDDKMGVCSLNDDLTKYIKECESYKAMCFGTPLYFFSESGMMRCLLERLMFVNHLYKSPMSRYKGKAKVGFITTMNISKEWFDNSSKQKLSIMPVTTEIFLRQIFGNCEAVRAFDTLQCNDYKKYHIETMSEEHKRKVHEEQFPIDLQKAYDLGVKLARDD